MPFSCRPLHTVMPELANQQELTNNRFCRDTGCSLEDLAGAMDDIKREREREREKELGKFLIVAWLDVDDMLMVYCSAFLNVPAIGIIVSVFANSPEVLSSFPGRVIPKTQKMVLDTTLLNTKHYKVKIKSKVVQSGKEVAPSSKPSCSSDWKGRLWVTLDYGCQLLLL